MVIPSPVKNTGSTHQNGLLFIFHGSYVEMQSDTTAGNKTKVTLLHFTVNIDAKSRYNIKLIKTDKTSSSKLNRKGILVIIGFIDSFKTLIGDTRAYEFFLKMARRPKRLGPS